jgi:hypothetical protein
MMGLSSEDIDRELAVTRTAWGVLQELEPAARLRAIEWLRTATFPDLPRDPGNPSDEVSF